MRNIKKCRVCEKTDFIKTIDLGELYLSGKFFSANYKVPKKRITLVQCKNCGLNQLLQQFDLNLLYDHNYGYQSSLNKSMYTHLELKARDLKKKLKLKKTDIILDIGSNDATTLSFFKSQKIKIGIDAVASKFKKKYKNINAIMIEDFFPTEKLKRFIGDKKIKLISSYSCFYDLPNPVLFAKHIEQNLKDDGIWVLEQSYLPFMLKTNSFDTICHEHIEYYKLKDIENICELSNLKIINVTFNTINGGSFSIEISKKNSKFKVKKIVKKTIEDEMNTNWTNEFKKFKKRIIKQKKNLITFLNNQLKYNKKVLGIGASTKGSVLLQYFGVTKKQINFIGEVNKDKFNKVTPGNKIPIINEAQILEMKPDYIIIFTWHFKKFFLENKKFKGVKMVFPLPNFEIVQN